MRFSYSCGFSDSARFFRKFLLLPAMWLISVFAVSLRIFLGTVAILFYILWRFSRHRIFNWDNKKADLTLSAVEVFDNP